MAFTACNGVEPPPAVIVPEPSAGIDPFVQEVVDEHSAAARQDPKNAALRGTLGLAYEANEMWLLARDTFLQAEVLEPDRPDWSFHAALAMYRVGESDQADVRIQDLVERFPGFTAARFRRGVLRLEQGDLSGALDDFVRCRREAANFAEVHVAEAEALVALDRFDQALERVDQAVKKAPEYKRANYVRGLALRGLGRIADAERQLTIGTGSERSFLPDEFSASRQKYAAGLAVQLAKAASLIDAGRNSEAVNLLEKVRTRRPDDLGVLNNLAIAYRGLKNPAAAVKHLTHAHEVDPKYFPTLINLSGCHWETQDFGEALKAAEKAVQLVPENGPALFAKAKALMSLQRFEEARATLEKSLRFDTSDVAVYGALAEAYMRLQRWPESERQWSALLDRLPGHIPAVYNLCLSQVRQGKLGEARKTLAQLKAIDPNHQATRAAEQLIQQAQ